MAGQREDASVLKRVERLGFPVKATPQHLLQSLQLPSQQPRQQQQQHEVSPGSPPAKTTSSATVHFVSPSREGDKRLPARLSLPGQLLAQQRSSSPPAAKLQALRASSPVLQHLLLPPLTGTGSRPGSEQPSPYLDVSTSMSAFTNSSPAQQHPHSPLGQQQQRRRGRRGWDGNTNPPLEPSFEDALMAWQEDTEAGVYGPKFLGSWAAVAYADLALLCEVLLEMRQMLATCLQLDSQLAAAIWFWHSVDRGMFLRAFRGHDLISQLSRRRLQQ
ncbi:hypothetical protein OEZ86_014535 [Tetradesmus obliquus]|nr:hypothetical protein OEZ86_014535 [Tetradesmus obliquus]